MPPALCRRAITDTHRHTPTVRFEPPPARPTFRPGQHRRDDSHNSGIDVHSPAIRALVDELVSIIDSFDHSGDDITTKFFGRVRVEDTTVVW
ncbi:hypothetical protein [Rhodococcoides yunnanense]|uniref:Uncharacterized protein n=1 Tax=Rhodococcoides yunnanense TaxID=278209 RepID=A0ABU4BC67_9NOCA|nr:hypothetical protein [Rhodococcus yunnanensis]MDV6261794.1 hypothetical protein [Rhodococcus yunnanensis]